MLLSFFVQSHRWSTGQDAEWHWISLQIAWNRLPIGRDCFVCSGLLRSALLADTVVPLSATNSSSVPVAIRSWITFLVALSSPTTRLVSRWTSASWPISCHVAIDINNNRGHHFFFHLILPFHSHFFFTSPPLFPFLWTLYRKWRLNPISMSSPEPIWVAKAPTSAKWCYYK